MKPRFGLIVGFAGLCIPLSCLSAAQDSRQAASPQETVRVIKLSDSAAVQEAPLLWKIAIPGLSTDVADMRFLDQNHILVCHGSPERPMVVDVGKGNVLWAIPNDRLLKLFVGTRTCSLAFALSDFVILQFHGEKEAAVLGADLLSGKELWSAILSHRSVRYIPVPAAATLLAVGAEPARVRLTAYAITTGAVQWEREFQPTFEDAALGVPIVTLDGTWVFFNGIEKIRPGTGGTEWKQESLLLNESSPPPQLANGAIFVVDRNRRLVSLDADQGRVRFSTALDEKLAVTNIFPLNDKIYLRARRQVESGERSYEVVAVSNKDGAILWTYSDKTETVSNLVEHKGRLFLASSSTLIALDSAAGKRLYAVPVTNTGGSFPVELRAYSDKIVHIGELVIAAFEPTSGRKLSRAYETQSTWHGMWSLIDFDRGVIYQQGLSALPREEQNREGDVRYGDYLVARRIALPK